MRTVKKIEGLVVALRGLMLLVVFAALVFMVTAMAQEIVSMRILRKASAPAAEKELTEEQKHDEIIRSAARKWQADGTMHLVRYLQPMMYPVKSDRKVEIYDADVNLLWSGLNDELPYTYLSGPRSFDLWHPRNFADTEFYMDFSRSLVVPVVSAEKRRIENWRYIPSGEYFTGYNARGETIGYLGAEGFCIDKGEVRSFGKLITANAWSPRDSYTPKVLWQSDKVLWQIDFEEREVEKIYESKDKIKNCRFFGWRGLEEKDVLLRGALLIYEDKGYYLVIDNPREVIAIEVPAEYSQVNHDVNILREGDNFYVEVTGIKGAYFDYKSRAAIVRWIEETRGKPTERWRALYRLGSGGGLEFLARDDWTRPADVIEGGKGPWERTEEFRRYTTAFSPVVFRPVVGLHAKLIDDSDISHGNNFVEFIEIVATYFSPVNMFYCLVLSLVSVCGAVYHGLGRRRSIAGLIGWLVFVGIFNVAGLLTYLAMNHKPVLKCSACGKKRHLIGDICIRCGRGLSVPERRETDLIFAG